MGGVLATMGTFAVCKAALYPAPPANELPISYGSAYIESTGDLFAPFPASDVKAIVWIGATMVIGGTLLRLKSYWHLTEEDK